MEIQVSDAIATASSRPTLVQTLVQFIHKYFGSIQAVPRNFHKISFSLSRAEGYAMVLDVAASERSPGLQFPTKCIREALMQAESTIPGKQQI